MRPNQYRTTTCGALRKGDDGREVRLAGWVHSIRDQRGIVFLDLRDRYGITQIVFADDCPPEILERAKELSRESTVSLDGKVVVRPAGMVNADLETGEVEVHVYSLRVLTAAEALPFPVAREAPTGEDLRLKYRFLDLRRARLQRNMALRARTIGFIRKFMEAEGFLDIHTPVLANSSPEGARDYLVPSRIHPGQFYALPQAPQQFKQLLMVAGFDRYYQIAPCFRDEDARADRSPGEFYQLDLEMGFAEQEDVFDVVERLFIAVTEELGEKTVHPKPFPRFAFREVMARFGTDKPDLRVGMEIADITEPLRQCGIDFVREAIEAGGAVRAICAQGGAGWSRSVAKKWNDVVRKAGGKGLIEIPVGDEAASGVAKHLSADERRAAAELVGAGKDDLVLAAVGEPDEASRVLGVLRVKLGDHLGLRDPGILSWGWITDFPMFEWNEKEEKIDFSHNPFSMPQGGLEALNEKDPLDIFAYQYDIFCNGLELSSGAVRNHDPEIMYRAFEIAGYTRADVDAKFGHMIRAFRLGAPPHAGIAPGIERVVMLLADEPNLREVVPFPKNQRCQDLMLDAPSEVTAKQLDELHIRVNR